MLISPAEIVPLPVEWLVNVQTRLMFFVGWLFFLVGGRPVAGGSETCSRLRVVAASGGSDDRPAVK
jgi:hypothetical protein